MSVIQQTIAYICLVWGFYCCSLQQTNTADMLDEAVEYVKFLQKQIQVYIDLVQETSQYVCFLRKLVRRN